MKKQVKMQKQATEFTEFTDEKKSITDDIENAQKENSQKVTEALAEAEKALQKARLEAFLKEKGLDEKTKFSDLTPEQRAEYDSYELPEAEKNKIYENAKNAIIPVTKERNKTLNSMEDRITSLYNKAAETKNELESKLASLPATPENEEERAKIEKDIQTLDGIMGELGPDKGAQAPMRATLASAFKTHENSNKGVRMKLGKLFGEEKVNSDPDIQNTLMTAKERKENGIKVNGPVVEDQEVDEAEKTEQEEQTQEGQEKAGQQVDPRVAAAAQQIAKNMGAVPAANAVVGDTLEDKDIVEEVTGMDYLNQLGYDGQTLKPESSRKLLEAFVNAKEDVRLDILKDTAAQEKIFEAMKVANNRWTPAAAFKFNKTRRALVAMANGPMMRKALEDIGEKIDYTNMDQVEAKFTDAVRTYEANRAKKQEEIDKLPDGDEKTKLQAELAEYDKQYAALKGVKDFRDISNKELTRFRDKVVDKMSGFFNRNEHEALKPSDTETKTAPTQTEQDRDDFRGNMQQNVNSIDEKSTQELEDMSKDTKEHTTPEQRAAARNYMENKDR